MKNEKHPLHKMPQDKTCQTKLIIQPNRFNRIVTLIIPSVFLQSRHRQPPENLNDVESIKCS